jgi:hypothetical protein
MGDKRVRISDQNHLDGEKAKQIPPKSGLYHTAINCERLAGPGGEINFIKGAGEQVMTNQGAWIVLGSDRPNSVRSGGGAAGSCHAASIDLVVGRLTGARKGKGPKKGAEVNPDFAADAARIHISQMTDIDHNFGIAQGHQPQSKNRSGIGMKADAIRIVGREGVKIVTGGMQDVQFQPGGEPTSMGSKIAQPSPGIELIAGNGVEDEVVWGGIFKPRERIRGLQGVALGYNTRDALQALADLLEMVLSIADLAAETSIFMFNAVGIALWMALGPVSAALSIRKLISERMSAGVLRTELILYTLNYLSAMGFKAIWSRNVKAT